MARPFKAAGIFLGLLFFLSTQCSAQTHGKFQKTPDGLDLRLEDGRLRIQIISDSIVRVAFSKNSNFFQRKSLVRVEAPASKSNWSLRETKDAYFLVTDKLTVEIARKNGNVRFLTPGGQAILSEADGGRLLEAADVQGEKTFHVRQQWIPNENESLYGLGQHQLGVLDLKGYDLDFWQHNTEVFVPFLVSSKGYGILWDNTSYTRFGDLGEFTAIPSALLFDAQGQPGGLTRKTSDPAYPETTTPEMNDSFYPQAPNTRPPDTVWEGSLLAPETGDYQFRCFHNGELKVWLDGLLVMDHLKRWVAGNEQRRVHLEAGRHYALKIEWKTQEGKRLQFSWKTPSRDNTTSLWSEVGEGVDYTFIYGPKLDDVVAGYRIVTGQAPLPPAWAFGLWQSRQRYENAEQSMEVVEGFRKRGVPFDNIVQDWRYWKDGEWGSHQFDPDRFPNPEEWLQRLHALNAHVMISVWGKYYPGTDNFKQLESQGCLYQVNLEKGVVDWLKKPFTYYDAFNPKARRLFWEQIDTALFKKGIDAWWMDATEPELTSDSTVEDIRTHMNPTALGTGARMLNAYPLMNSMGIYEGQRQSAPDQRVFILTRSGFAGMQRYGAAVWSGDITSTWATLAKQIPAGLGFSLSGLPYWTSDIGGYMMPTRFFPWKCTKEDEDEWRELNVRWFQFGAFCPLLRVHGEMRKREMWELGGDDSPAFKAELKFDRLRYSLYPYIYSAAANVTHRGGTIMRPLVMDFPEDTTARTLTDEYMFGQAFLAAPVVKYKARKREVYLPSGVVWYDFWTGKQAASGKTFNAPAPYDQMPLFVRAGSIIPFGPERQYIAEKTNDPITLYVYEGADGDFTLYEDDGLTNGYEKGAYSEIPIHWDDAGKRLVLGERRGEFVGMLKKRKFEVVIVGPKKKVGYSFDAKAQRSVVYEGRSVTLGF
jgi:alpha-D-xyloside xylohydrolase